jgi:hypothetical protein
MCAAFIICDLRDVRSRSIVADRACPSVRTHCLEAFGATGKLLNRIQQLTEEATDASAANPQMKQVKLKVNGQSFTASIAVTEDGVDPKRGTACIEGRQGRRQGWRQGERERERGGGGGGVFFITLALLFEVCLICRRPLYLYRVRLLVCFTAGKLKDKLKLAGENVRIPHLRSMVCFFSV